MKSERVKAKTGRYIYIGSQDTNVQVHIKAGQGGVRNNSARTGG